MGRPYGRRPVTDSTFIRRVALRHYKSIAACDVTLGPLTLLVGPNGAGKSNFLDALSFVRDALRESLEFALRHRGGINEVRRRSGGHPTHLGIRIDFRLPSASGWYAFEIGALPDGGFKVAHEKCVVQRDRGGAPDEFEVINGDVITDLGSPTPPASTDRLYLVNAAGLEQFRAIYEALRTMGFYNLNPKLMADLQDPDEGALLDKYGSNLASVLARLQKEDPSRKERIRQYLTRVAPTVHDFKFLPLGPKHAIEFRQTVEGQKAPWRFYASSMSDGTLRALGVLTAAFQFGNGHRVRLVGMEEPETALHPAAAGVLLDSLREASETTQIIVTTHSGELLDRSDIQATQIRAVVNLNGRTIIGDIDTASRDALNQSLFTAGQLLRLDQIAPARDLFAPPPRQADLFSATNE